MERTLGEIVAEIKAKNPDLPEDEIKKGIQDSISGFIGTRIGSEILDPNQHES